MISVALAYSIFITIFILSCQNQAKEIRKSSCLKAFTCRHNGCLLCALQLEDGQVRWFKDTCDLLEFNCEYQTILMICCALVSAHGPPSERDNDDIVMGRKMGSKWCSMAKVCNHDRMPVCGVSHAGDVMGFRDLCDMFDFNCIRRRNYKQTTCPDDKSMLTVSRRPTNSFYDD